MTARSTIGKFVIGLSAVLVLIFFLLGIGLFFEQGIIIPVKGATSRDWNPKSFWHPGWGASGVHKGIDIFAPRGTDVLAAASGLVVFQGELKLGGKALAILDPKWRLHYYAHLDSAAVSAGKWVSQGNVVGKVGNTGNAQGRPPHLHYTLISLIPRFGRHSGGAEGWKLMFFLNPDDYLG
jgi:murein DD-endopeptidase MepM/ murein hydrolase activator NlpD